DFTRIDEVGEGGAHFEFDAPRGVVEVHFGALGQSIGFFDFALRFEAVEDVPGHLDAGNPAVNFVGENGIKDGSARVVAAKGLNTGLITGACVDEVFFPQGLGGAQGGQLSAALETQGNGPRQIEVVRDGFEVVGQLHGNILERLTG